MPLIPSKKRESIQKRTKPIHLMATRRSKMKNKSHENLYWRPKGVCLKRTIKMEIGLALKSYKIGLIR